MSIVGRVVSMVGRVVLMVVRVVSTVGRVVSIVVIAKFDTASFCIHKLPSVEKFHFVWGITILYDPYMLCLSHKTIKHTIGIINQT